ncbi:hypothetical protein BS47DRAFT_75197 [Hydnum rufescens UP504]|uniref:Uncharacterized protein n=1 Tax=Hydnum rufescens UP504 TaxID=1448309 RepID=A0A9P6E1F0_9AGAM|nr:hypothetical protein BS47DRAFT_75197 [Hydnum rufescens UP504]
MHGNTGKLHTIADLNKFQDKWGFTNQTSLFQSRVTRWDSDPGREAFDWLWREVVRALLHSGQSTFELIAPPNSAESKYSSVANSVADRIAAQASEDLHGVTGRSLGSSKISLKAAQCQPDILNALGCTVQWNQCMTVSKGAVRRVRERSLFM